MSLVEPVNLWLFQTGQSQPPAPVPPPPEEPPMATVQLVISPDPPGAQVYTGTAVVNGVVPTRVEFWVDGALFRTELSAPYTLFVNGGTGGFGAGTHTILVKVYSGSTVVASVTRTLTEGSVAPTPSTVEQQIRTSLTAAPPYGLGWSEAMVDRLLR